MKRAFFVRNNKNKMRNDYYFDDLDIENFFLDDQREPGVLPTTPGLVDTRPENVPLKREKTRPLGDPLMGPVQFNANGKLKDKLKTFAQSEKGKKILKIGGIAAGAGVLIAFGPQIIAALAPVMPAMKAALSKQGLKAKGPADIIKKFSNTQLKMSDDEKKDPKKIIAAIFKFFKDAKERRAAGTASPLDELVLKTADNTLTKISDGTLSVDRAVEGEGADDVAPSKGKTKEGTESTEKKGLDMKLVLVILVAVFFLTKK